MVRRGPGSRDGDLVPFATSGGPVFLGGERWLDVQSWAAQGRFTDRTGYLFDAAVSGAAGTFAMTQLPPAIQKFDPLTGTQVWQCGGSGYQLVLNEDGSVAVPGAREERTSTVFRYGANGHYLSGFAMNGYADEQAIAPEAGCHS